MPQILVSLLGRCRFSPWPWPCSYYWRLGSCPRPCGSSPCERH